MKKIIGFIFLILFLLGHSGFFVYEYLLDQSDRNGKINAAHEDFTDLQLLKLKIPLHLPYYRDQTGFESVEGEITYQGVIYDYVKKKVSQDTLILLCLRNAAKTNLTSLYTSLGLGNHPAENVIVVPVQSHGGFLASSPFDTYCLPFVPSIGLTMGKAIMEEPFFTLSKPFISGPKNPPDELAA